MAGPQGKNGQNSVRLRLRDGGPEQSSRPEHITPCAASGMANFSTWHVWIIPRKLTQTSPEKTVPEPLSIDPNASPGGQTKLYLFKMFLLI